MNAIVSSTKELNEVGGDITKVSPQTRKTIEDLTKTKGGRWRFEYQINGVVNQYLEYVGLEDNELFQNMSNAEKTRLFDVPNSMEYLNEVPENARKRARKLEAKQQEKTIEQQAASYAIQQNPKDATEFVNYVEFYKARSKQKIAHLQNLYLDKFNRASQEFANAQGINIDNLTQKQIAQIHSQTSKQFFQELYEETAQFEGKNAIKKYITEKVYETSGTAEDIGQINPEIANDMQSAYQQRITEVTDNIGATQITPNLSNEETIQEIKYLADNLKFGNESAAAYHSIKHYEELPPSHFQDNNEFNNYWKSAIQTIKKSTDVESSFNQNGSRSFVFKITYNEVEQYDLQAIVNVDRSGKVIILTYFRLNKKQ